MVTPFVFLFHCIHRKYTTKKQKRPPFAFHSRRWSENLFVYLNLQRYQFILPAADAELRSGFNGVHTVAAE